MGSRGKGKYRKLQLSTAQARRQKKLQHPPRPVENVVITSKDLHERKTQVLNGKA